MFATINKVKNMLKEADAAEYYVYQRKNRSHFDYLTKTFESSKDQVVCAGCKQAYSEYDTFPVKGLEGKTKYFCVDCITDNIDWCEYCQEPYEIDPADPYGLKLCPDCLEAMLRNELN
jgi:hypothetical protein